MISMMPTPSYVMRKCTHSLYLHASTCHTRVTCSETEARNVQSRMRHAPEAGAVDSVCVHLCICLSITTTAATTTTTTNNNNNKHNHNPKPKPKPTPSARSSPASAPARSPRRACASFSVSISCWSHHMCLDMFMLNPCFVSTRLFQQFVPNPLCKIITLRYVLFVIIRMICCLVTICYVMYCIMCVLCYCSFVYPFVAYPFVASTRALIIHHLANLSTASKSYCVFEINEINDASLLDVMKQYTYYPCLEVKHTLMGARDNI